MRPSAQATTKPSASTATTSPIFPPIPLGSWAGKGLDSKTWIVLPSSVVHAPACRSKVPVTRTELELVWGVNARIFYVGVRKYIYGMEVPRDVDALIDAEVGTFFSGIGHTLRQVIKTTASTPRRGAPR